MKTVLKFVTAGCLIALASLSLSVAQAQSYAIDWYKIAGGGGTSSGGNYSLSGTIGQADASSIMSGGNYSVTGGFWSLIQVIQTPGAPTLYVSQTGNVVKVYWQNVSGWNLVQSGNLTTTVTSWSSSTTPTLIGGTNYLSITNPTGNVFFRLKNP
jgi:hypothetical protein